MSFLKYINNEKKINILTMGVLLILGFVVYFNSLNGEFVWDDWALVRDNQYIRSWINLPKILTEDMGAGASIQYNFFRPVLVITYMIDYTFWRSNVFGYHLTNVVLHILVTLLIYWLINILYNNKLLSFLTSLFFMVHPVHTESVAYISGRSELLPALFILICFIFYIKQRELNNVRFYTVMLISYILATLSKENALVMPLLLLLYHYAFKRKVKYNLYLPLLSIVFVYILLRATVLRALLSDTLYSNTFIKRIPGFFVAITNYLRILIIPINLHMDYGDILFSFIHSKAILGFVISFLLIIYAFLQRKKSRLIFFSISWFFITLLPVSSIYPLNAFYMAEHWLYLPSLGFCLFLADCLYLIYRREKIRIFAIFFMVGLTVFYFSLTVKQNSYWHHPISFFKRTLKFAPHSAVIYNNLGIAYRDIGDIDNEIESYKRAIEIDPAYLRAYNNIAKAYNSQGKREEVIVLYQKAIDANPNSFEAYTNLATAYVNLGKYEEAIGLLNKAIGLNPDHAYAYYYNLGLIYTKLGDRRNEIVLYQKAIDANPNSFEAYTNLATAYVNLGKYEEAIGLLNKAIGLNPDHAYAYYYNLGRIYNKIKDKTGELAAYREAIRNAPCLVEAYKKLALAFSMIDKQEELQLLYEKAIANNLSYFDAYYNLGNLYSQMDKSDVAIDLYKKAVRINPSSAETYFSLGSLYCSIGKNKKAIIFLKKALQINPDFALAHNNLAVAYYFEKEYELAVKHFDKAIKLGYEVDSKFAEFLKEREN